MDPRKKWSETMARVGELNESHGVQQRGGKKYTQVVHRMEALREHHGLDFGVSTEILIDDGKRVVMKAVIHTNDLPMIVLGTGHAEELRGEGMVNKTSAIENCETSAIGRALASIGLSGGEYASANEMEGVTRKTEAKASTPKPPVVDSQTEKDPVVTATNGKPVDYYETHLLFLDQISKINSMADLQSWKETNKETLRAIEEAESDLSAKLVEAFKVRSGELKAKPTKVVEKTEAPKSDPVKAEAHLQNLKNKLGVKDDPIPFP